MPTPRILASLALPLLLSPGCGSGSDPLLSLGGVGNPSLTFPTQITGTISPVFNSNNPFFLINAPTGTIISPGQALVLETTTTSVTLRLSSHVTSTVSNMTTVSIRPGDFIAQGATLGTGVSVEWAVLENGTKVCPLAYLSATARAQLLSTSNPCQ